MSATRLNQAFIPWLTAFVLAIFVLPENINAQTCLPEGVKFTAQTQIDSFSANYPACSQVLGAVVIKENTSGNIINLNGLASLKSIGGRLEIKDNDALESLNGLNALASINGRLNISSNSALSSLDGLEALIYLGESLAVSNNKSLKDLSSLKRLIAVKGDLFISSNAALQSLKGLNAIRDIKNLLIISYNQSLVNLEGLESLISIGDDFNIFDNASLNSLSGMKRLRSVGHDLVIEENSSLLNLHGLDSLNTIGGFLQIANNPILLNIRSLRSLTSIGGLLQIYRNPFLESLSGLDSIQHESIGDLAILLSDLLSVCGVKSICDYLEVSSNGANITQNNKGCNTREEILNTCSRQNISSPARASKIVFFPNPTREIINVKGIKLENAVVKVTDSLGKLVQKGIVENNAIDLSILPTGLYFIEITTDEKTAATLICKVEY